MSAEEALFACTFLEENAQVQLLAEIMGGAIALSEAEARDCAEGTFNPRLFPLPALSTHSSKHCRRG
jgi:hypothetical protein